MKLGLIRNWLSCAALPAFVWAACTPQQAQVAKTTTVRIADDVCKELQGDPNADPEMVLVACAIDGGVNVINVLLPRTQWHELQAKKRNVDAGPGK